jgi:hypothetical protein
VAAPSSSGAGPRAPRYRVCLPGCPLPACLPVCLSVWSGYAFRPVSIRAVTRQLSLVKEHAKTQADTLQQVSLRPRGSVRVSALPPSVCRVQTQDLCAQAQQRAASQTEALAAARALTRRLVALGSARHRTAQHSTAPHTKGRQAVRNMAGLCAGCCG